MMFKKLITIDLLFHMLSLRTNQNAGVYPRARVIFQRAQESPWQSASCC